MTLLPTQPPLTITRQATLGPVDQLLLLLLLIHVLRRLGILPAEDSPTVVSVAELLEYVGKIDRSRLSEAQLWADRLAAGDCVVTV